MAKFVYAEAEREHILLMADPGEEIPVEMATAWALIRLGNTADIALDVGGMIADAIKELKPD